MSISEMNREELEARSAEIRTECETAEEARLMELNAEADEIQTRLAELTAIEQRKADAAAINAGTAEGTKVLEKIKEKEERRMDFASVEYRNAWLANMMGREVEDAELRSAVTGAGAVIPQAIADKIAARLNENALIGKVDVMNVPGYVRVPVYSTNNAASWTTTASDSADAITYIDLKPYQLIKTIEIGADMDKMSFNAFESEIVKILGNAIETALQKAIIVGAGSESAQPTGIAATVSADTGTFTKAGITKADLMTIMGSLPADFQRNACWIMPNALFYEIMSIATINDFAGIAAGVGNHIGGKPVVLDDNCVISSTDTIFYGDPAHYRLNLGEGVNVSKDLSVGFRSNSAVYRGVCQADGQLDMADAFVRYSRAS